MTPAPSPAPRAAASQGRTVVIANAGSGKTWTLANRILRWTVDELRAGREPRPSGTVAVTFTRKAAGEILARVLAHAALGARADEAGAKARKDFSPVVGDATQGEYLRALKALCHDLHRLPIGTLDGFFHRIATAMPEAIGLPAEWTLGEERELEELRARAAAEILADKDAERMLDLLEQGAPKPSVSSSIEALLGGSESMSPLDMYRAVKVGGDTAIARAFGWMKPLLDPELLAPERWEELAVELESLPVPGGKKPNGFWGKAVKALAESLRTRDLARLAKNGFLDSLVKGKEYRSHDPSDDFVRVGREIGATLRAALIADLDRKLEGARAVLPKASEVLARLQREQGLYGFSDVTRGIAEGVRGGTAVASAQRLREALGVDLADLALDEAQDTSVEQFLALRPLLEEVLAKPAELEGERSSTGRDGRFLLVGDPKQSIYGWRGGTPGLIAEIEARYADRLGEAAPLTKSFRSSPILMDFVNRVFADLKSTVPALVGDKKRDELLGDKIGVFDWVKSCGLPESSTESAFTQALAQWRFTPHESARPELSGTIAAYACGEADDSDGGDGADADSDQSAPRADGSTRGRGEASDSGAGAGAGAGADADARPAESDPPADELTPCACAAEIAARIVREHPGRTVGILTRTNKAIGDTIRELKLRGIAASDEGRATLLDSPAVTGVVAMLRLVDSPQDRVSHFIASRGPIGQVTRLKPLEEHGSLDDAYAAARTWAARQRAHIADQGLGAVLRSVSDRLRGLGLSPIDAGRLERVVAIAESIGDEPPARLIDFIDEIEADSADSSSPDAVRVMTVHRAKGLEFDEVIVVSLDDNWGKVTANWGMVRADPAQPPQMVALLGNADTRRWVPELTVFERDERRRRLLDDLSAFYVAVTRAKRGLHLVMSSKPKGDHPTAAKLINEALGRPCASKDTLSDAEPFQQAFIGAKPDATRPFWSCSYGLESAKHGLESAKHGHESAKHGHESAKHGHESAKHGHESAKHGHESEREGAQTPTPATTAPATPTAAPSAGPLVEIKQRVDARAAAPSSQHQSARRSSSPWDADPFADEDIAVRGVFVHECFREVRSIEALVDPAARAAIIARARRRAAAEKRQPIPDSTAEDVARMLDRTVASRGRPGSVGAALAVPRGADESRVLTELAFAREVDGALVNGRIDRLVIHSRDGVPVGATIVDFKTGAVRAGHEIFDAKVEGYRTQLAAYGDAVAEMFTIPRDAIRLELLFVDRDEVVELGADR
jgi:ATP-dependent exoDNAse (exonuclease V) beta subunit